MGQDYAQHIKDFIQLLASGLQMHVYSDGGKLTLISCI